MAGVPGLGAREFRRKRGIDCFDHTGFAREESEAEGLVAVGRNRPYWLPPLGSVLAALCHAGGLRAAASLPRASARGGLTLARSQVAERRRRPSKIRRQAHAVKHLCQHLLSPAGAPSCSGAVESRAGLTALDSSRSGSRSGRGRPWRSKCR